KPHVLALRKMLYPSPQRQFKVAQVFLRQSVVPSWIEWRDETHDFVYAHPAVHRLVFGQIADVAAEFDRFPLRIEAQYADRAVVALQQAEQHPNRCRFAGRVATEERKRAAALDSQRHTAEHLGRTKRFVNGLHF